jgi:hypothetical protein
MNKTGGSAVAGRDAPAGQITLFPVRVGVGAR